MSEENIGKKLEDQDVAMVSGGNYNINEEVEKVMEMIQEELMESLEATQQAIQQSQQAVQSAIQQAQQAAIDATSSVIN